MDKLKPNSNAFMNFEDASQEILAYLHEQFGFALWMTTRTIEPNWIVLQSENHNYGAKAGAVLEWADSICSKMVMGKGPNIAPRVQDIPSYASAKIRTQLKVGAYIGVPINTKGGELFGTLCAMDPEPQDEKILQELPHIQLFARLLGSILSKELEAGEFIKEIARLQKEATLDPLTGILNRKGWEVCLQKGEARAKRYGTPICILILDLDGLKIVNDTFGHPGGDKLIRDAAQCLNSSLRDSDIVARIGGDEFGIMALECSAEDAEILHKNVIDALAKNGIKASVGKAIRDAKTTIEATILAADKAMYESKHQNRLKNCSNKTNLNAPKKTKI